MHRPKILALSLDVTEWTFIVVFHADLLMKSENLCLIK